MSIRALPPGRGADRNQRPEAASRSCRAGRRSSSAPRRQQTASPARGDRTGNIRRFSAVSARSESHFGPCGQSLTFAKRGRKPQAIEGRRRGAAGRFQSGPAAKASQGYYEEAFVLVVLLAGTCLTTTFLPLSWR